MKVHFNTVHAIERGKSAGKSETLAPKEGLEKAGVEFTNGKRRRANYSFVRGGHKLPLSGPSEITILIICESDF
jgi:hypothetical protein